MGDTWDSLGTRWQDALADSRQLVFLIDASRRVVAVSGGMAAALGATPDELIGHTCASFMHEAGDAPEDCPLHSLLLDGRQHDGEVRSDVLGKDLFVTVTPLLDQSGSASLVLHVATDITERKRVEGALRESEALLRESQRVARLGHYVLDIPAGTWTSSAALDRVFGIGPDYARSVEGWLEIVHPDDRAAMSTYLQDHVLRDRSPFDREYRVRRIDDGETRWVHGLGTLEEDASGDLTRMFGVIQDVTEQHASRRALERGTMLLEEAERLAHLGSWEWDLRSGVTHHSEEWQRIYGVDSAQIPVDEGLELVHEADRAVVAGAIDSVVSDGGMYRAEYRIIRPDNGEIRHLEGFGQPVFSDDGTVDRVYGATLDVTQRVEAELRLRRTLSATVAALATTTEMRDPYTAGHMYRVAELASEIGRLLEWDDERVDDVRIAALLHDIGKVVVPSEILSKPGRLTESEFALIKAHSSAAGEILAGIEWVGPITQTVVQHHERLDGSGYPLGLRGEAIIPEARVLAVADVYEAMVSHRPYRPALPPDAAADELRTGAGICYDAQAVSVCLRLIEDGFAFSAAKR